VREMQKRWREREGGWQRDIVRERAEGEGVEERKRSEYGR